MPTVAIDILFAGLMIFVPNTTDDPTSMMVYLVKQAQHEPSLTIFGNICLEDEQRKCTEVSIPENPCGYETAALGKGREITCRLDAIQEIAFDPELVYQRQFLRQSPPSAPATLDARRGFAWLPRILSFESKEARASSSKLDDRNLVGARMKVGWESARTCALDGGECNAVNLFRFVGTNVQPSAEQAIAEEVLLTADHRPGRFRIRLRDRANKEVGTVRVDCGGQHCMSMLVQNTMKEGARLPGHFAMYYDFVDGAQVKRTPEQSQSTPTNECDDVVFQECALRLLEPVQPDLVARARQFLQKNEICSWYELGQFLLGEINEDRQSEERIARIKSFIAALSDFRRIHDRIVCPPVMLEP
jgi:hypothetical protein